MARTLPWDWYDGTIPANVEVADTAYIETSFSFSRYRSEAEVGVRYEHGAHSYLGTMFDVGPRGRVRIAQHALLHGVRIICDDSVEIGDHAMLSWNVVLMDSYRVPRDPEQRRPLLRRLPETRPRALEPDRNARPVVIGANVWVGFGACVLPGVTIGTGSIVAAQAVVLEDVAPYTIVAGNPARAVRELEAP